MSHARTKGFRKIDNGQPQNVVRKFRKYYVGKKFTVIKRTVVAKSHYSSA